MGEVVDAVGELADLLSDAPLGVFKQGVHVAAHLGSAVAVHQVEELALAEGSGGDLGADVAEDLVGDADIGCKQVEHGLVGDAAFVELGGGDAEALLVYLVGVGGVAAGDDAADVGLVGDGAGEALQFVFGEDGLDDVDVWQVDAAGGVGVVHNVEVAGVDAAVELAEDGADGAWEGTDVEGDGEAHGDGLPVAVGEGGGEVHGVLDDAGVSGAEDGECHLVDEGVEGVSDDLEGDGFYVFGEHGVGGWGSGGWGLC